MGFFQNLFSFRTSLTEQDRETIWKQWGSFIANAFSTQGNDLIRNSYEKNGDVYALTKKIVDISKSVPWIVERKLGNGEWKEMKGTTIHDLMENPNETKGYTWNDIEEMTLIYLLLTGNAYVLGERPFASNLIGEIDVLPSNHIEIKTNDDFFITVVKYLFTLSKTKREFTKEDLAHIKFFNPGYDDVTESMYGLSIIKVAAGLVQAGNDRIDAAANLLQNRGAVGMITDKSPKPMTPEEAKKVQADWQKDTAGSKNFGKIKVTNKDLSYIQMAMSAADLQLVESGVVNLRALCNVFGLDSSLFNDPANKTYNNQLEAQKALYTNAIMPLSDKVAEHFTRFIARNHFPDKTVRMRQDFSKVECLQENAKEKNEIVISQKVNGIITANEARIELKKPTSTDENSDKLIISSSNVLLSDVGASTPPVTK